MKRFVCIVTCMLIASAAFAGPGLKVSPIYGTLLSPKFSVIKDIAGSEITKGGVGASAQYLMGISKLSIGAEVSYMPLLNYKYEYLLQVNSVTSDAELEFSAKAIPVLGVASLELPMPGKFTPYIQGGLGLAAVMTEVTGKVPLLGINQSETETETGYCVMMGGGLLMKLAPLLAFDISVKYYNIGLDFEIEEEDTTSVLTIGGGIYFRL